MSERKNFMEKNILPTYLTKIYRVWVQQTNILKDGLTTRFQFSTLNYQCPVLTQMWAYITTKLLRTESSTTKLSKVGWNDQGKNIRIYIFCSSKARGTPVPSSPHRGVAICNLSYRRLCSMPFEHKNVIKQLKFRSGNDKTHSCFRISTPRTNLVIMILFLELWKLSFPL